MRRTCAAPHSIAPPGVPCVTKQLLSLRTRISQLSSIDEQSGSSAHNHSTTLVTGRAAAAPGSATPELDSTHMNGLIDDKKRCVIPTVQSKCVCVCVFVCRTLSQGGWESDGHSPNAARRVSDTFPAALGECPTLSHPRACACVCMRVCVLACACVRTRACARAHARVCLCVCITHLNRYYLCGTT